MITCVVPVISFNYAIKSLDRCKRTLRDSIIFGMAFMVIAFLCFVLIPIPLLKVFTADPAVWKIGQTAFRMIAFSFFPIVTSLLFPVFFQAVGFSFKSSALTIIRTLVLFVPLGYLFSRFGLTWFWLTFPVTEIITTLIGYIFYRQFLKNPYPDKI